MFGKWEQGVKLVATLIANAAPEAFAGPVTEMAENVSFDLERDFSAYERDCYLALAQSILDATPADLAKASRAREAALSFCAVR